MEVVFTIPILEPIAPQYYIRLMSDRWLGSDVSHAVTLSHLILPESYPPHTGM